MDCVDEIIVVDNNSNDRSAEIARATRARVVAKLLEFLFNGPSLSDCGCTLRLVHRTALLRLLPHFAVGGSHFLPEMVILGLLSKMRMVEILVHYRGRLGKSKITGSLKTAVRVGWCMVRLILDYRMRTWLGRASY